eukprot:Sspe_Gene.40900::Locus_19748_Transcript_1_1_Confidence_1.000_Length_1440::g.40900::m.40900/K16599/TTLL1; tubulin polyglutamylase TTLL1
MKRSTLLIAVGVVTSVLLYTTLVSPTIGAHLETVQELLLDADGWKSAPCVGMCPRTAFVRGQNAEKLIFEAHEGNVSWKRVHKAEEATLIWLRNHRSRRFSPNPDLQVYNKFPTSSPITDKSMLYLNVKSYEKRMGFHRSPLPETFVLDSRESLNALSKRKDELQGRVWIMKKTSESMGRGVFVVDDPVDFLRSRNFSKVAEEVLAGEPHVFQRYIENPLLLEGRKSELRLYWAVLSLDPLFAVVFPEGQVRLNSLPFVSGDYANPMRHLTNAFQQRGHPEFEKLMASGKLKWTLVQWRSYLVKELNISREAVSRAESQMRWALLRALNATYPLLGGDGGVQAAKGRFELFGADFILDRDMNVYLTEVQQGPGLSFGDPVKHTILRNVLKGTVELAYKMLNMRQQNASMGDIGNLYGFEALVDASRGYYCCTET